MATKGQPITHDELIEKDVFQNTIEQAVMLRNELTKIVGAFKQVAAATGKKLGNVDPKTITEAQQLAKSYEDTAKMMKGYTDAQKQLIYNKEKIRILSKQESDALKANAAVQNAAKGSIAELRAELKRVTIEWANLSDIEGENAGKFKELSESKLELTNRLKALEAATGDHRREVGNYAVATKGLTGILTVAAEAMGVNKEAIEELKDLHKSLKEGIHGTHELLEGLAIGHHKEAAAANEAAAAEKAGAAAKLGTIPIIGLVIASLALLGAAIYAVILKTEAEEEAERDRSRAVDGTVIKNKELRDSYNEHIIVVKELADEYKVLRGEISRYEAEVDKVKTKVQVNVSNIRNETKEKIEEAKSAWGVFKDFLLNNFSGSGPRDIMTSIAKTYAIKVGGVIQEGNEKIKSEVTKGADEIKQLKLKKDKEDIEDRKRYIEQALRLAELNNDLTLDKELEFLKKEEAIEMILAHERGENLLLVARDFEIKRLEILEKYFKKSIEKLNEEIKLKEQRWKDEWEAFKKLYDDKNKKSDEYYKKQVALIMDNERKEAELQLRKDKTAQQIRRDKKKLEDAEYQKRVEDLTNMYDAEQKKTDAYRKAQEILKKEHEQNVADIEKEYRQKKLDQEISLQEQVIDATAQALDRQNQLRRSALGYQAGLIDDQIKVETELAARGNDNKLDYLLKKKAENIAQQKELDRKAQKEQEYLQLANIYLEFMKVYAKDGPGAAAKAIAQTFVAKGIAASIAGAFKDGVENLDGSGTETSDSNLALLSKGESVVTAKGTKENPGLATAMNTGKVEEYFKSIYTPRFEALQDKSSSQMATQGILSVVQSQLDQINKTLAGQRHFWIEKNVLDQIIFNDQQNGQKTTTIREHNPIVQRNTYNKK